LIDIVSVLLGLVRGMEGDVVKGKRKWREDSFINSYQGSLRTIYAAAMLVS